jgi:hypothetical protein
MFVEDRDGKLRYVEKCPFKLTMLIIFFVFSIGAVIISFYAYRIFKAQAMGRLAGAMIQGGVLNRGDNNQGDNEAPRANYLPPPAAYRA